MRIVNRTLLVAAILATSPAAFSIEAPPCVARGASPDTTAAAKSLVVSPAAAVLGTTSAEIHARFAGVIEQNFRTGNPNKLVHALTSHELADLANFYKRAGGTTTLLELMAKHVDADGLTLIASAFGQTETAAAAASYAPRAVYMDFKSLPVKAVAESSLNIARTPTAGGGITADAAGPAPTVDMTPYEIYLDYRTAPVGSLSVEGALYEAGVFIGTRVATSGLIGYQAGTVVNTLIETYDPDLEDAIGGTVAGMLQQLQDAVNAALQGELEKSFDNLFGVPLSYNSAGDYDVAIAMADLDPDQCT
jgi:hypothetical protein